MAEVYHVGVARFAFVVELSSSKAVEDLVAELQDRLTRPMMAAQVPMSPSFHAGICGVTLGQHTADEAIRRMLVGLNAAINSRAPFRWYSETRDARTRRGYRLATDAREALQEKQFHLVYQPQVDYRDHSVVGVEALLRWQHPQHGFVPPDLFIPLAEQNGTIIPIGEWILDQTCRQLREWHDQGFTELRMAVNLSTVQLHHAELPRVVNNLMQMYRLPPRSLELEVTETGLMEDISTAAQHLLSLRRSGALIAIDDFGTGYSSLSYLKSLPLDKIKIDKSFVQDLLEDEDDATIVRAIIQLGKSLGMQVIAEGVETVEQEAYIIAQGCNEGQGYLYSKPLPARELTTYLKQARRLNSAANPATL